jgi:hypothetical protein
MGASRSKENFIEDREPLLREKDRLLFLKLNIIETFLMGRKATKDLQKGNAMKREG